MARFLNPILAGDHPDPTIIRDGDVWYMTFSSFEKAIPAFVIWKSPDLVNWTPVTAALKTNVGSVWAPELVKHPSMLRRGRYYLYIPARASRTKRSIYVIHAERIEGPGASPSISTCRAPSIPATRWAKTASATLVPLRRRPRPA